MVVHRGQSFQKTDHLDADAVEAEKAMLQECEGWFAGLPLEPNGEVLSRKGAIRAVKAAATHYAKEILRYRSSPKSSKVTLQLKELAGAAERASKHLAEADAAIQNLNKMMKRLSLYAAKRIGAVPSPILRILNESESGQKGLLEDSYSEAIRKYGDAKILSRDRHVLRSEIFRLLADKHAGPPFPLIDQDQIDQIRSIEVVFSSAASLPGIANPKGGQKLAFQEFTLYPSYQLVEACMAILHASKLSQGNSQRGHLFNLATAIRQSVEGPNAAAVTRAIEDLPRKTTDTIPRLKGRLNYWAIGLLIDDIKTLPVVGVEIGQKLSDLEFRRKKLFVLLSRKATPGRLKTEDGSKFVLEYGAWTDVEVSSPFL